MNSADSEIPLKGEEAEGPIHYTVTDLPAKKTRIDNFLTEQLDGSLSRARIQSIIKMGGVMINEQAINTPKTAIALGDKITFQMPEPEIAEPQPENIPLSILYEDDAVIVINKAAGMVVHPAAGNWNGTLVNALLHHCAESLSGIGGVKRPGIVHRLDKDTSGVMIIAKHDIAHQSLAAQFADHGKTTALKREYQAIIWGITDQPTGSIEGFLGRDNKDRLKRAVVAEGRIDAKFARTHYKRLEEFPSKLKGASVASHIACVLETGRTHQIRVHLASINHPLIGDQTYGRGFLTKAKSLSDALDKSVRTLERQALHAGHLTFEHPISGDIMSFDAPIPADMEDIIAKLRGLAH